MANLTLVYGLRLLPSDEVAEVGAATIKLKSGREAHVTMHTLEGSKDEIAETTELAAEKSDLAQLAVVEGAGIELSGGLLGKQLAAIRKRDDQLRRRMGLIVRGVLISAGGAFLQIVGSFGQALKKTVIAT